MPTFHHGDFLPLDAIARLKRDGGHTVSLVIPTLNEESTIGGIVDACRRRLVDEAPLLDEILVIDGSSDDRTSSAASKAGAVVHQASHIRPDIVIPRGKGASMWKSLFVVRGSIVVFIDADIVDFGPHFVYGLVAPLVARSEIVWAKAFYRRPFVAGHERLDGYGGRVTEILARPLLSAWYPALSHIHQPLSGECAFRTDAVKAVPFASGYGVEMQLLLQMWRRHGLDALAEVDMDVRQHRNRPVAQLGRMSMAILRTFLAFLEADRRVVLCTPPLSTLVAAGGDHDTQIDIADTVLPAVDSVGGPGSWKLG